jgi:hypothetical protein
VPDWQGDNPFSLVIFPAEGIQPIVIDLDERGWATRYADHMRAPGQWYLVNKQDSSIPIAIWVHPGEQPYYTARHIGIGSGVPDETGYMPATEIIAYGIGKKRTDGHVDRLWVFRNGLVVAGDDVEKFGIDIIKKGMA